MTLAEEYFLEFKKQSKLDVTFEGISDNELKIYFDRSEQFYVHITITNENVNIKKSVTDFLKSEY